MPTVDEVRTGADDRLVLLQAMKEDPPLEHKCRDKFLVQSVAVTPDRDFPSVASLVRLLIPHPAPCYDGFLVTDHVHELVAICRAQRKELHPGEEDSCCLSSGRWRAEYADS